MKAILWRIAIRYVITCIDDKNNNSNNSNIAIFVTM